MASISFGFGVSHGPLLVTPPDKWELRTAWDRQQPVHHFRGGTHTFDELVELRRSEDLAEQITPSRKRERFKQCRQRIDELGALLRAAAPDVIVVAGDDQREWISPDMQPPFVVYHGQSVTNLAFDELRVAADPTVEYRMRATDAAGGDATYPVAATLAEHLIEQVCLDGFDVAASARQPADSSGMRQLGHAWGFVCRQLLQDNPPPLVPVLINTFYPPNRPSPQRCFEFGRALGRAIQSWPSDMRVAIGGSGGLSHFVIDEDFDRKILDALATRDTDAIARLDDHWFRAGTSEIKNWLVAAGALFEANLSMRLLDYIPCYRSVAGTGCAMGFAVWEPA